MFTYVLWLCCYCRLFWKCESTNVIDILGEFWFMLLRCCLILVFAHYFPGVQLCFSIGQVSRTCFMNYCCINHAFMDAAINLINSNHNFWVLIWLCVHEQWLCVHELWIKWEQSYDYGNLRSCLSCIRWTRYDGVYQAAYIWWTRCESSKCVALKVPKVLLILC